MQIKQTNESLVLRQARNRRPPAGGGTSVPPTLEADSHATCCLMSDRRHAYRSFITSLGPRFRRRRAALSGCIRPSVRREATARNPPFWLAKSFCKLGNRPRFSTGRAAAYHSCWLHCTERPTSNVAPRRMPPVVHGLEGTFPRLQKSPPVTARKGAAPHASAAARAGRHPTGPDGCSRDWRGERTAGRRHGMHAARPCTAGEERRPAPTAPPSTAGGPRRGIRTRPDRSPRRAVTRRSGTGSQAAVFWRVCHCQAERMIAWRSRLGVQPSTVRALSLLATSTGESPSRRST